MVRFFCITWYLKLKLAQQYPITIGLGYAECEEFLQDKTVKEALNNTRKLDDITPEDFKVWYPNVETHGVILYFSTLLAASVLCAGRLLPRWAWTHVGSCEQPKST